MARRASGGRLFYYVDLRGRRRGTAALRRALPELDARRRRQLLWRSYIRTAQTNRAGARALRATPVSFCRRLVFQGWENLHNAAPDPFWLLAPLGSPGVAARVVELYHTDGFRAEVLAPESTGERTEAMLFRQSVRSSVEPARRALETGAAAIWVLALLEPGGRWQVRYLPPVPPLPDDNEATLTGRYLSVLEGAIREHPAYWPWREPCVSW